MTNTAQYHGRHTGDFEAHVGLCLTPDFEAAWDYAGRGMRPGTVVRVALDLDGLTVVEVDGYDHDADTAPGDSDPGALAAKLGADVILYEDETQMAREHVSYRLLTARAVAAVTIEALVDEDGDDIE